MSRAQRAQAELARRQLARRHLIDFAQYTDPDVAGEYEARHLELIATFLEQAEDGTLWNGMPGSGVRILCITTPPRHWKSSLVSRKFLGWFVGKRKAARQPHQFILASYGASLAESHSRAVIETVMENPLYANVFPEVTVSMKSHAAAEWALEGEPFPTGVAAGVGGGLTGHGADCFVIDDPIKDRAEANSAATRKRQWDWWTDVARTRVNPGGFVVIVLTRWHEEDLVGLLLKQVAKGEADERIVVLRLPALAETPRERTKAAQMGLPRDKADPLGRRPGEALWEERIPAAELRATRKASPLTFDALYQGRPRPDEGFLVGRDNFKILPAEPTKDIRWFWASDFAITEKETAPKGAKDPDYTVVGKVGLWTPDGPDSARLVISDVRRGQVNPHQARTMAKEAILSTNRRIPFRSGQAHIDKVALFGLRADPELLGASIKNLAQKDGLVGDKSTRAQPWFEMTHAGLVYLVQGEWNEAFLSEAEQFPHGSHDDQIDMVSVGSIAHGMARRSREVSSAKVKGFG